MPYGPRNNMRVEPAVNVTADLLARVERDAKREVLLDLEIVIGDFATAAPLVRGYGLSPIEATPFKEDVLNAIRAKRQGLGA